MGLHLSIRRKKFWNKGCACKRHTASRFEPGTSECEAHVFNTWTLPWVFSNKMSFKTYTELQYRQTSGLLWRKQTKQNNLWGGNKFKPLKLNADYSDFRSVRICQSFTQASRWNITVIFFPTYLCTFYVTRLTHLRRLRTLTPCCLSVLLLSSPTLKFDESYKHPKLISSAFFYYFSPNN